MHPLMERTAAVFSKSAAGLGAREHPARRARMAAYTLLEVLVAIAVLSIGLLGLAGLQAASLRNNQSAALRTQASHLAYDMADRMRANAQAVADGAYDGAQATAHGDCTGAGGCNSQDLAENDTAEWSVAIAAQLPGGQGLVCLDSTPSASDTVDSPDCDGSGSNYAIKIWWDGDRDGSLDTPLIVSVQP